MNRHAAACLLASLGLLGACARLETIGREPAMTPPGFPQAAVSPPYANALPMPAPAPMAPPSTASLWRPVSLFQDSRARQRGDILTVVIQIDDRAEMNNRTTRSRDANESLNVGSVFGFEDAANRLLPDDINPEAGVDLESGSESGGNGSVGRGETIELKVAATVTDVLPNGNLAIVGSQEVRVNYELRDLQVAGVVRPQDVSRDNTVDYDKIAEARIVYGGRGQVYDLQQPRYGQQVLDVILPF